MSEFMVAPGFSPADFLKFRQEQIKQWVDNPDNKDKIKQENHHGDLAAPDQAILRTG